MLITLGIIGIVAAITIPNVTALYRRNVVETRLAKFYSSINQAIRLSEVDNGSTKYWDIMPVHTLIKDEDGNVIEVIPPDMIGWYNKYLAKYLNTIRNMEAFYHLSRWQI